jgi:hypothetical protein
LKLCLQGCLGSKEQHSADPGAAGNILSRSKISS